MAKASKAFNKIENGTPGFKPQFKKPSYNKQETGFYKPNEGFNNSKKPYSKPNKGDFKSKPKPKFEKKVDKVATDKRLHNLFMSTKDYTLLFKAFSITGNSNIPMFNKLMVKNTKTAAGENVFSYYLYDANLHCKIDNWNNDLEIVNCVFYGDTNVMFTLKDGTKVTCEQIISKKFIEAKFQEIIMGKRPTKG